jgi:hypothetical protein
MAKIIIKSFIFLFSERNFLTLGWSMFLLGKEEGINQLSKLATSALHTSSLRGRA